MATGSPAASSAKESSDDDADRSENGEDDGLGVASSKSASKNLEDDEDVMLNSSNQQPNDFAWERRLLETLARVSLASLGGGLVGLSLDHKRRQQRQQRQQQQPHHQYSYPASSRTTATTTAVSGNRPRQRPPLSATTAAATSLKRGAASLAKTWSVSCFLFATILETTRWISPTTVLYDFISQQQQQQQHQQGERENVNDNSQTNSSPSTRDTPDPANAWAEQHSQQQHHSAAVALQRLALTVAGDYTIGGSLAGFMVASLAQQQHAMISRSIRLPLPVFGRAAGVGLGTALGLCAGLVQATIAVGEMYIQQQQQEQ